MKILKISALIALSLIPIRSMADEAEMPIFNKPPTEYFYHHIVYGANAGPNGTPEDDGLLIGDKSKQNLKFWFELDGNNFHICSMSGLAKSISHNSYMYESGQCKLRITFPSKTRAEIQDIGNFCEPDFCAINAYIDKTKFVLNRTHKLGGAYDWYLHIKDPKNNP
jgi:hypothetical protein